MKTFRPLRWATAMILALVCAAGAQITNSASVEFLTKSFNSPNVIGEPLVTATIWADPDTMPDISIRAVVADTTDSTHVDLNVTMVQGPLIASKKLTDIRTDSELWLPDSTWGPGIIDSLFSIVMLDTRPLIPGEEFKLEIKNYRAAPVFLEPPLSRLTVISAWSDTLADDGDTTYSDAVWGGYRWMNWAFNGITSSTSDDDLQLGFGYQDKFGADWTRIRVVEDSLLLEQDVVVDTTFERGVADSCRVVIWGISTTTNLYLEFLKWIGRN